MKVYIVGAGPGAAEHLTVRARELIGRAGAVLTTARLAEQFRSLNAGIQSLKLSELLPAALAHRGRVKELCLLVSGDAGFYSASKELTRNLAEAGMEIECLPGLSSLSYLAARLGSSYEDVVTVSAHGRSDSLAPWVSYHPKVFALTGGRRGAAEVIDELRRAGLTGARVTVGENLGLAGERVTTGLVGDLAGRNFAELAVLWIENPDFTDRRVRLRDDDFIRGRAPMTKEAVRRLSLAALEIRPEDLVLDVGAGTGSVSVEAARLAHRGLVYAVEKNGEALDLLKRNIRKFGAYNVISLEGTAPEILESLPAADKAFIGGAGGRLPEIARALFRKNPALRLVVNALALETLAAAQAAAADLRLKTETLCVNAALAERAGPYQLMKAQNPVYIISAVKEEQREWL